MNFIASKAFKIQVPLCVNNLTESTVLTVVIYLHLYVPPNSALRNKLAAKEWETFSIKSKDGHRQN